MIVCVISFSILTLSSVFGMYPSLSRTNVLKLEILQLGASLDRGQAYNPTSGRYYEDKMATAKAKVLELVAESDKPPVTDLAQIAGEWELCFTSVPHGIFRSSPFFQAIQYAYTAVGAPEKANLFFKLHELQTCSWGASKVGRVAQYIDPDKNMLFSEFDTSLFSLTTIPILGWGKLLPTFGGCVITASKAKIKEKGKLELEVEYTAAKPVEGLAGLGNWIWGVRVPVGAVWKLLPWNKGRAALAEVKCLYCDESMRIVEDTAGEVFVYCRPVVSRPLFDENFKEESA